jgi:hypothetical protein
MHPSKWEFKDFLPCNSPVTADTQSVSFLSILLNIQLEAFLWGLGTAIGELPPYFMARAAAEAGKINEEVEELKSLEESKPKNFMDRVKAFLYQHLKKHGFITVLLCASVINNFYNIDSQSVVRPCWNYLRTFLHSFLDILWSYYDWQSYN